MNITQFGNKMLVSVQISGALGLKIKKARDQLYDQVLASLTNQAILDQIALHRDDPESPNYKSRSWVLEHILAPQTLFNPEFDQQRIALRKMTALQYKLNSEVMEILQKGYVKGTFDQHPTVIELNIALEQLQKHYQVWFGHYEKFEATPEMVTLFVTDLDGFENVGFPQQLPKLLRSLFYPGVKTVDGLLEEAAQTTLSLISN